jgi:hypothetical protein
VIKAIETRYKGYNFRSRLEARWAVFFDALGIEWEYEPEGFELPDGTRYLPDFWLKRECVWVEIKGQAPTHTEKNACFLLAQESRPVLLLSGALEIDDYVNCKGILFTGWRTAHLESLSSLASYVLDQKFDEENGLPCLLRENGYWPKLDEGDKFFEHEWERNKALCLADVQYFEGKYGRKDYRYEYGLTVDIGALSMVCGRLHLDAYDVSRNVTHAITAARSARFEHGQSGASA